MNNNDFNFKRMDKGIAGGEHKIIFKTPDGKIYEDCEITVESDEQHHHTCVVNLTSNDKIEPIFKVGDVVINTKELNPKTKLTVNIVNVKEQYYKFKESFIEIKFKDQDKLKLLDTVKPNFKVGDVVTNISGLYPNVRCTITTVDEEKQCYYFREINGTTSFKDQDKLMLVKSEEVRPPVKDDNKLDILEKSYASDAQYNTFKYNLKHYKLIENISKRIIAISEAGAVSYHLVVPMKQESDEAGIYYVEDEVCGIIRWHFDKLGYKIDEKVKENEYNEFFISW